MTVRLSMVLAAVGVAATLQAQDLRVTDRSVESVTALDVDHQGQVVYVKPITSWANATGEELATALKMVYGVDAELESVSVLSEGMKTHTRVRQMVGGIPVEGAELIIHRDRNATITGVTGSLQKVDRYTGAVLDPADAVTRALATFSKNTPWSRLSDDEEALLKEVTGNPGATYTPTASLVYAPVGGDPMNGYRAAYKLTLQSGADQPARWVVYVDAQSGTVLNKYNSLHTTAAVGSGVSLYSGTVSINTDLVSSTYYMRDLSRKVETYDMKNKTNYGTSALFTDTDNVWNTTTQKAGVDAHYGAAKTWDYYKLVHGRNSYDNLGATIKSYVHYSSKYNNAYWNGSVMTYGDGDGTTFTPLVTLDVAGHEITHAVTEKTANLTYQNESGALNEAFSDIFGAAIEFYANGASGNWLIGEACYTPATSGDALRSMSNPNAEGQPDTYQGTYWYTGTGDNGGVHYNSRVANFWFYLLSVGGSGTNDKGTAYSVTGLGISKAEKIAYRALSVYMTSSTNYAGARTATLNAASDLYGSASAEYTQVGNAWTAVGVGTSGGGTPPPTSWTNYTEVESNGSTTAANTLPATPVKVTAKIGTTTDNDYFKATINATSLMTIKLTPPSTKDYDLYILNSAGTQIAKSENGTGAAETLTIQNSGTSAATLYIRVKGYNRAYSTTLNYTVEVSQAASVAGITGAGVEGQETVAESFKLLGNYPNPFNPSTTISFAAPEKGLATIRVYNLLGQEVAVALNEVVEAGTVNATFNAAGLPSGTYLYRVTMGQQTRSGKLTLMK